MYDRSWTREGWNASIRFNEGKKRGRGVRATTGAKVGAFREIHRQVQSRLKRCLVTRERAPIFNYRESRARSVCPKRSHYLTYLRTNPWIPMFPDERTGRYNPLQEKRETMFPPRRKYDRTRAPITKYDWKTKYVLADRNERKEGKSKSKNKGKDTQKLLPASIYFRARVVKTLFPEQRMINSRNAFSRGLAAGTK